MADETQREAVREARAGESENRKNLRTATKAAIAASNEAQKEAIREMKSAESQNKFNRRQATKAAVALANETQKEAIRANKAASSENKFNLRKATAAAVSAAESEQARLIREDKVNKSKEENERRKAKKEADASMTTEQLRQIVASGGKISICMKSKPVGPITISYEKKKIGECKGDGKDSVVVDTAKLGGTDDFVVVNACGKDTNVKIVDLCSKTNGEKTSLGYKKSLKFVEVSGKVEMKASPLAELIKKSEKK